MLLTSVSTVRTGIFAAPYCLIGPTRAVTSVGATIRKSGFEASRVSRMVICGAASNVAGPCQLTLTPSFFASACAPRFIVT